MIKLWLVSGRFEEGQGCTVIKNRDWVGVLSIRPRRGGRERLWGGQDHFIERYNVARAHPPSHHIGKIIHGQSLIIRRASLSLQMNSHDPQNVTICYSGLSSLQKELFQFTKVSQAGAALFSQ